MHNFNVGISTPIFSDILKTKSRLNSVFEKKSIIDKENCLQYLKCLKDWFLSNTDSAQQSLWLKSERRDILDVESYL